MRGILPALIVVSLCAACNQDLSVHVRGGDRPPNPEELVRAGDAGPSGELGVAGGVTVDHFQIVLRSMRMQEAPTDGGVDAPGAVYVGPGPYLIDMTPTSLTGGAFTDLISGYLLGPKSYYELDVNLQPVSDGDVSLKPELAPLHGNTFVITGRNAQSAPFTFQSQLARELVRPSVYRLGTNHNNIDVNIAPNLWFVDPDGGTPLDPATTDPAVRALIEENVLKSIDAYEDDNMDGIPDPLG